ncbi:MAG: HAD hydrolase family protein, partial [Acidobacteriota bacterium]
QAARNKLEAMDQILDELKLNRTQAAYLGDDLPDLAAIQSVALSAAPSDAAEEVRRAVTWRLDAAGGQGVVREFVERFLRERGDWDDLIAEFSGSSSELTRR